jgi:hypothetical protein
MVTVSLWKTGKILIYIPSDYLFNAGPIVSSFSKVSMSTTKKIKGTY